MEVIDKLYKKLQFNKSIFRSNARFTHEFISNSEISPEDLDRIVKSQLAQQFADYVIENFSDEITKKTTGALEGFTEYSIDLLIINKGQLKNIVDGCILTMSDEDLLNYKSNV